MIRVELHNPDQTAGIFPGMTLRMGARPKGWRRIWRWIKRKVLRRYNVELSDEDGEGVWMTVTAVDYETGTIDLEGDDNE